MFLRNDHYDRGFLFASYGGQCFAISLFFFKEVSIHWFTKRSVLEVSRKHACVCKHATIVLDNLTEIFKSHVSGVERGGFKVQIS